MPQVPRSKCKRIEKEKKVFFHLCQFPPKIIKSTFVFHILGKNTKLHWFPFVQWAFYKLYHHQNTMHDIPNKKQPSDFCSSKSARNVSLHIGIMVIFYLLQNLIFVHISLLQSCYNSNFYAQISASNDGVYQIK